MAGGDMLIWRWSWLGLNMWCVLTLTLRPYWHLWNDEHSCGLNKSRPLRREREVLWCFSLFFFFKSGLLYVSLLTGRKLGESVHLEGQQGAPWQSHLWEKPRGCGRGEYFQVLNKMPITHRDLRVDRAAASPRRKKILFFLRCLCNTAGNGFVTTANQGVQPLRRDYLIRLTQARQGEFTLQHQFWFYTACICKWGGSFGSCCRFNQGPVLIKEKDGKQKTDARWIMAESCLPRPRSSRRHPISLCTPVSLLLPPLSNLQQTARITLGVQKAAGCQGNHHPRRHPMTA